MRVDDKGRLAIPATFRKQLREGSFVSVGQDQVLAIYPPDLWNALGEELKSPLPGPDQRALSRTLYPLSDPFEPDGQAGPRPDGTATAPTRKDVSQNSLTG